MGDQEDEAYESHQPPALAHHSASVILNERTGEVRASGASTPFNANQRRDSLEDTRNFVRFSGASACASLIAAASMALSPHHLLPDRLMRQYPLVCPTRRSDRMSALLRLAPHPFQSHHFAQGYLSQFPVGFLLPRSPRLQYGSSRRRGDERYKRDHRFLRNSTLPPPHRQRSSTG